MQICIHRSSAVSIAFINDIQPYLCKTPSLAQDSKSLRQVRGMHLHSEYNVAIRCPHFTVSSHQETNISSLASSFPAITMAAKQSLHLLIRNASQAFQALPVCNSTWGKTRIARIA